MDDDLISRKELRKAFKESGYFTGPWLHWARLLIDIAPAVDNYSKGYQDGVKQGYERGYSQGFVDSQIGTDYDGR